MKFRYCLPKNKGFSLIEVLVALFILGAIGLVIANIPQVLTLVKASQSESKVREVVAKKIEDIRLAGYANLANGTVEINDSKLASLNNLEGVVLTEDCPAELCPNGELVKKITITITWDENSQPKGYSITTLVAKGGLI